MNEPPDAALITRLLHEWRDGSHGAFERLVPLVYDELRAIAARQLSREWRHDHLQITAVVNEAYLRLFRQREVSPATVKREWVVAKGWLYRELTGGVQRVEPA
jgi:DNA-directed RNA polymerase specialized sigma24 family protein